MATCASPLSRNRSAGENIARGQPLSELRSATTCAEGLSSVGAVLALAARYGVEMPICEMVAAVLAGDTTPTNAVGRLMGRPAAVELRDLGPGCEGAAERHFERVVVLGDDDAGAARCGGRRRGQCSPRAHRARGRPDRAAGQRRAGVPARCHRGPRRRPRRRPRAPDARHPRPAVPARRVRRPTCATSRTSCRTSRGRASGPGPSTWSPTTSARCAPSSPSGPRIRWCSQRRRRPTATATSASG